MANKIGMINPTTHAISEFTVPNSPQFLGDITAGPDGSFWFTGSSTDNSGVTQGFIGELSTKARTAVSLTAVPGPSTFGQKVTFTTTVMPSSGSGTPTGNVTFSVDGAAQTPPMPLMFVGGMDIATFSDSSLGAGAHSISATYNGDSDFSSSSAATPVPVTVEQAPPTVVVTDPGGSYTGSPVAATATVTGVGGAPGSSLEAVSLTLTYYAGTSATGTPLAGAPITVGTYTVLAAFPGSADYTSAAKSKTFAISRATPTVSWTKPADITTGTALGAAQLDATASVPGTFAYTPTGGTVLVVGQGQVLSVTFTPTDTTNYTTASGSTSINVVTPTPPQPTGIAGLGRSKKGLTSISLAFNEALESGSASNVDLYSVLGAVKKKGKTVYNKKLHIKSVSYNAKADSVTIKLAKPYKGAVQVTVQGGLVAANGAKSSSAFSAVAK
jgi:hypothetical protein